MKTICDICPANKDGICSYYGIAVSSSYSMCNVANFVNTFYNNNSKDKKDGRRSKD